MSQNTPEKRRLLLTWAVLLLIPAGLAAYKLLALDYRLSDVLPQSLRRVTLTMQFDGWGGDLSVRTLLPVSDTRQTITSEQSSAPGLHLATETVGSNRIATWTGARIGDRRQISYTYDVASRPVAFDIADAVSVPPIYSQSVAPYLRPEEHVQVDSPEIAALVDRLGANQGSVKQRLRAVYDYVAGLPQRPFKGTTDALTALRLGEASCNGKSRLFVAATRAAGIPARLIGGFIMQAGDRRVSHQWVEAYVAGHWVPFDPTNRHFAALPENFLTLYYGDESLFRHTADINFDYRFHVGRVIIPSPRAKETFRVFNVWALFERLGLPFSLLRTILMLPIGALVVVVFRNVIGLPTFGTFLPALIAASATRTGPLWGVLGVALVVLAVVAARWMVRRLELLHSPTLAILLATVTMAMLATSLLAEKIGFLRLANISLFPIAVLAITAERFYVSLTEQGPGTAARELGGTFLVIFACYVVMSSLALQILVIGFPEILLVIMAANVYLGRWIGIRVAEYLRFRHVLVRQP